MIARIKKTVAALGRMTGVLGPARPDLHDIVEHLDRFKAEKRKVRNGDVTSFDLGAEALWNRTDASCPWEGTVFSERVRLRNRILLGPMLSVALLGDKAAQEVYLTERLFSIDDLPRWAYQTVYDKIKAVYESFGSEAIFRLALSSSERTKALNRPAPLRPFEDGQLTTLGLRTFTSINTASRFLAFAETHDYSGPIHRIKTDNDIDYKIGNFTATNLTPFGAKARQALRGAIPFMINARIITDLEYALDLLFSEDFKQKISCETREPWKLLQQGPLAKVLSAREVLLTEYAEPRLNDIEVMALAEKCAKAKDVRIKLSELLPRGQRIEPASDQPEPQGQPLANEFRALFISGIEQVLTDRGLVKSDAHDLARRAWRLTRKGGGTYATMLTALQDESLPPNQALDRIYQGILMRTEQKSASPTATISESSTTSETMTEVDQGFTVTFDGNQFSKWLGSLDTSLKRRVEMRLGRFEDGNLGFCHPVAGVPGLQEAMLPCAGGLRIYFSKDSSGAIIIFRGGDKSNQARDITEAGSALRRLKLVRAESDGRQREGSA